MKSHLSLDFLGSVGRIDVRFVLSTGADCVSIPVVAKVGHQNRSANKKRQEHSYECP